MITLREALTRAASQLAAHPALAPTAVQDATLLLMHALALDRAALLAHPERSVTREEMVSIQALITRRLTFEPIQYILGQQEFFGLALKITPAVLIPRPETELLVEAVLGRMARDRASRIADVGTGSGAIAIALAHALPLAHVTALDLSAQALALASENAESHHVADRIRFVQSDLLAVIEQRQPFDAIVSNPPYIPAGEAATLHPQVRDHEPAQALFAGPDGLEIYRRLIPQAHSLLASGGLLALEIGYGQSEPISELLRGWTDTTFLPDLQGIPRVALALRS